MQLVIDRRLDDLAQSRPNVRFAEIKRSDVDDRYWPVSTRWKDGKGGAFLVESAEGGAVRCQP